MMKNYLYSLMLGFLLVFVFGTSHAQNDTLITVQGDQFVGELKSFERGVVTFKTPYSYSDFTIKYSQIARCKTERQFKTFDEDGDLVYGKIDFNKADTISGFKLINGESVIKIKGYKIGKLEPLQRKFKERLILSTDIGYTQTKQDNLQQLSLDLKVGYEGLSWNILADYYSFASRSNSAKTRREDISLTSELYLPKRWFVFGQMRIFSSSELDLDSRSTPMVGLGNYIIYNYFLSLQVVAGASYNYEIYTNIATPFESAEAFGVLNINYYPTKDIDFSNSLMVFPSLTESGRTRLQWKSGLKFNYFKNLDIGLNYSYNLDTKPPVADINRTDFIVEIKLGWSLND